jgi:hypothetical protein
MRAVGSNDLTHWATGAPTTREHRYYKEWYILEHYTYYFFQIKIPLAVKWRTEKYQKKMNKRTNMNYETLQFKMNLIKNRGWSQVLWKGRHMFLTNWCTQSLGICRPSLCHDRPRQPNLECHGCCRRLVHPFHI